MESIQQSLSVLFVLALLGGTLWWLRSRGMAVFAIRRPGIGKTKAMRVIERAPLTAQHTLHLVQVADRTLLIATSPGGCSILDGVVECGAERMAVR